MYLTSHSKLYWAYLHYYSPRGMLCSPASGGFLITGVGICLSLGGFFDHVRRGIFRSRASLDFSQAVSVSFKTFVKKCWWWVWPLYIPWGAFHKDKNKHENERNSTKCMKCAKTCSRQVFYTALAGARLTCQNTLTPYLNMNSVISSQSEGFVRPCGRMVVC